MLILNTGLFMGSISLIALLLLAQGEPISGGAGWVGAGLLGSVLAWLLLVHIPNMDKQIMTLIADCDAHNEKQRKEFIEENREIRAKFDSTLRYVTEQATKAIEAKKRV